LVLTNRDESILEVALHSRPKLSKLKNLRTLSA
jgi:hypothetical protein